MKSYKYLLAAIGFLITIQLLSNESAFAYQSDSWESFYYAGIYGFRDRFSEKIFIEPKFDETHSKFSEGYAAVKQNGKWGYIDETGSFIIDPTFDKADNFSDGMARVCGQIDGNDFKCGYIDHNTFDSDGYLAINMQFDGGRDFVDGAAPVWIGSKCGYIDKSAQFLTDLQFDDCYVFIRGIAPVKINGKWGLVKRNSFGQGNVSISTLFDELKIRTSIFAGETTIAVRAGDKFYKVAPDNNNELIEIRDISFWNM